MGEKTVQLVIHPLRWMVLLLPGLLLVACTHRGPLLQGALSVPAHDALIGTPAENLLDNANQAAQVDRQQAESLYLERAIRIAPNSSWLYKKMADLRLAEGDPHAAEGFARHALRNAPTEDVRYQASLWQLLSVCLMRQGETQKASDARARADALQTGRED
jgi:predicted Zn-dependent protease